MKLTEVPISFNNDITISHFVVYSISHQDFRLRRLQPHSDFCHYTQTVTVSHAHSPTHSFSINFTLSINKLFSSSLSYNWTDTTISLPFELRMHVPMGFIARVPVSR